MFWTEQESNTLTELWIAAKSAREIAWVLGKTRNAVIGKAFRLGLSVSKPKKWTDYFEKAPETCQSPIDGKPIRYCGANVKPGSSYCAEHHAEYYRAGTGYTPHKAYGPAIGSYGAVEFLKDSLGDY